MSVEDLSKELEVSEITIRRDLQQFEDQGGYRALLRRRKGILLEKLNMKNVDQIQYNSMKKKIARRAAGLVRDHNMVLY